MINAIIIEDEQHCINHLHQLISNLNLQIKIVDVFKKVEDAIKGIRKFNPNLVFMDVELADGNSFNILKKLNSFNFEIIFTTAHNKYAIEAFEYSAIHYLLKPIDEIKFTNAIKRVIDKLNKQNTNKQLQNIIHNLNAHSFEDKKIAIPTIKGFVFYKAGEIIRIEAEGNYCTVFLSQDKNCLATKHLKYYEKLLDERYFFRTHQSHLVNLAYVDQYVSQNKNSYIKLSNGSKIPVSVRRKSEFINFLSKNKHL